MIAYVNGKFVPEEQAMVSVFDRGFTYGDGLFETVLVSGGKLFKWQDHFLRMLAGASLLRLVLPESEPELLAIARELLRANGSTECLLRIGVSRGLGPRGYSPSKAVQPSLVLSLHPLPNAHRTLRSFRLVTSSLRAHAPLASAKTSNKLVQILARAEADEASADDALLLDSSGLIAETAASNIFWIINGELHTPPLNGCVLPGVTRAVALQLCNRTGLLVRESSAPTDVLNLAEGVFLTQTSFGIVEVSALDGRSLNRSALTYRLHGLYWEEVKVDALVES